MSVHISTRKTQQGDASPPPRSIAIAIMRGAAHRCPACGIGSIYRSYLKIIEQCRHCNEALHHHQADDAPAYFTILIIGHIIVAGILMVEQAFAPEAWLHTIIWIPLTLVLSLLFLPRIKAMLVSVQWSLRMHGFDEKDSEQHSQGPIADTKQS